MKSWRHNEAPLIVFSHLRWDFVKQRPQHLMERLSQERPVGFVEEPITYDEETLGTVETYVVKDSLMVVKPRIQSGDFASLSRLLGDVVPQTANQHPVLWFYSPAFVEMASYLDYSVCVYDCMDELSQFRGAPKELVAQERTLLALSDVVFTGGKSLFASKKRFHDKVYCFPSSVDKKHFAKALDKKTAIPEDLQAISTPIVGFYGVIDERLDHSLLQVITRRMPYVSFVMIGPVVKVRHEDLPKAPNLFYLGQKEYADLPHYLKGFDVAFMPFALNEATEFISPTKTLEFMAAYKPIVSTPIYDVVRDYDQVVKIASNVFEMEQQIRSSLRETVTQRKKRMALQGAVLKRTSWDITAMRMGKILTRASTEPSRETTVVDNSQAWLYE